jgi:hypothetical protein
MITSWVIACIRGHSSNGSPSGQRPTSPRVTSAIISVSPGIRSRWNGGSISRRRVMWSGSSSSISERAPSTGSSSGFARATPRLAAGAVKTRFTCSGSQRKTQLPEWRMRIVKISP